MPSREPSYRDAIQAVLMLRLLDRCVTKSMPLGELAERLEVDAKTVKRYVDALGSAVTTDDGKPIVTRCVRDRGAWVELAREAVPVSANVYQYAVVWAASRWFTSGQGSVLGDTAKSALESLEKSFGHGAAPLLADVHPDGTTGLSGRRDRGSVSRPGA